MKIKWGISKCIIVSNTRWGWHVRIWLGQRLHGAWNPTYGWHIVIGRFVRSRTK